MICRLPSARLFRRVSACVAALLLAVGATSAQVIRELPQLEGVGVDERVGQALPGHLEFTDESGRIVRLNELLGRGRPAVLVLGYYGCPMLCGLVLNGFLDAARNMPWTVGREYDVIYVSIDPNEQPPLAAAKREAIIASYGREGSGAGWRFLTASAEQSAALAASIGFRYRFVEERNEWAHPSVLTLIGADGRIGRYLYGVQFDPRTLKMGLTEARQGSSGTTLDQLLLYCFHYDANEGRYVIAAQNVMRVGGAVTVLLLAAWVVPVWMRSLRGRGPGTQGSGGVGAGGSGSGGPGRSGNEPVAPQDALKGVSS